MSRFLWFSVYELFQFMIFLNFARYGTMPRP